MNALINFSFDDQLLRVVLIGDEPWFVADDLAKLLGYDHTPHMLRMLPERWVSVRLMDRENGKRNMKIIAEGGMWLCIGRSNRPEAVPIQEWMFGEVMPSIRRTGRYELPGLDRTDPPCGYDPNWLNAHIAWVRQVLRLEGPAAARRALAGVGLSRAVASAAQDGAAIVTQYNDEFLSARVMEWLEMNDPRPTLAEIVAGVGLDIEHEESRDRVRSVLRAEGWWSKKARGWSGQPATCWFPPEEAA